MDAADLQSFMDTAKLLEITSLCDEKTSLCDEKTSLCDSKTSETNNDNYDSSKTPTFDSFLPHDDGKNDRVGNSSDGSRIIQKRRRVSPHQRQSIILRNNPSHDSSNYSDAPPKHLSILNTSSSSNKRIVSNGSGSSKRKQRAAIVSGGNTQSLNAKILPPAIDSDESSNDLQKLVKLEVVEEEDEALAKRIKVSN